MGEGRPQSLRDPRSDHQRPRLKSKRFARKASTRRHGELDIIFIDRITVIGDDAGQAVVAIREKNAVDRARRASAGELKLIAVGGEKGT